MLLLGVAWVFHAAVPKHSANNYLSSWNRCAGVCNMLYCSNYEWKGAWVQAIPGESEKLEQSLRKRALFKV